MLAYVGDANRRRFAQTMRGLPATWISNETPGVVAGVPVPARAAMPFVVIHNGQRSLRRLARRLGRWLGPALAHRAVPIALRLTAPRLTDEQYMDKLPLEKLARQR